MDCSHGSKKPNGNCDRLALDDGLPIQCVGPWAKDKHDYLRRYIDATRGVRAKYLTPAGNRPAGGAAFVDLFAGPGRCCVRGSRELIDGSPLIALEHTAAPFTKVIACDLDRENTGALQSRVRQFGDRAVVLEGNCNTIIDQVTSQIPPFGLNIALLDPFGVGALDFRTISKLAAFTRMDLIIHFPTMDMKRNFGRNQAEVDRFLGTEDEDGRVSDPSEVVTKIETLRNSLAAFEYRRDDVRSMPVYNDNGNVLYHLVFVSKNRKGSEIWSSIARTDSKGQRSLF